MVERTPSELPTENSDLQTRSSFLYISSRNDVDLLSRMAREVCEPSAAPVYNTVTPSLFTYANASLEKMLGP